MGLSAVKDFASSTTARIAVAGAITLSAFAANAQSLPFEAGKCHDMEAVKVALKADGQKNLFFGDRITDNSPANFFTMNDKGYGYNLEFKKASTPSQKDQLCLRTEYKDIQLNYVDNSQIPSWAKRIKPNKGIDVQKMYSQTGDNVARLVFVATTYTKNANGNEINGKAIAVAVQPFLKGASVWSIDSSGVPNSVADVRNFEIHTKNFNDFMGRGFGSIASSGQTDGTLIALKTPAPQ